MNPKHHLEEKQFKMFTKAQPIWGVGNGQECGFAVFIGAPPGHPEREVVADWTCVSMHEFKKICKVTHTWAKVMKRRLWLMMLYAYGFGQ